MSCASLSESVGVETDRESVPDVQLVSLPRAVAPSLGAEGGGGGLREALGQKEWSERAMAFGWLWSVDGGEDHKCRVEAVEREWHAEFEPLSEVAQRAVLRLGVACAGNR